MWNTIELKGYTFDVCDDGRVIRKAYTREYADGRVFNYPDREMKKYLDHGGYQTFTLGERGKTINYKVGQVVAYAFPSICGEWFEGAQVNHKNEDKTDNRACNLEWTTPTENTNWGTGTERARKKKLNKGSKMMPEKAIVQMTKDGEVIKEYPSIREATRETGIEHSCISRCCSGSRNAKTAGGFKWSYV